jgi:sugar phosphate isomerase/epimerase
MRLSLSVRLAEEFESKETASMTLAELAALAVSAGYDALCMRASQVGIHSTPETVACAAATLRRRGLGVSMVTGDFDVVYNNERGPAGLRRIQPCLELARALGAPLIRVALKSEADIPWAQRAAEAAQECGLQLAHQCHTESLFETVDGIERALDAIDRPNFGLIYEPANLELCGQDYGAATIRRFGARIFNVYLQNQALSPQGQRTLHTWHRGPVRFDLLPLHASGGVDLAAVFEGLVMVGYRGPVTVHQAALSEAPPAELAVRAAVRLRRLAGRCGL